MYSTFTAVGLSSPCSVGLYNCTYSTFQLLPSLCCSSHWAGSYWLTVASGAVVAVKRTVQAVLQCLSIERWSSASSRACWTSWRTTFSSRRKPLYCTALQKSICTFCEICLIVHQSLMYIYSVFHSFTYTVPIFCVYCTYVNTHTYTCTICLHCTGSRPHTGTCVSAGNCSAAVVLQEALTRSDLP